MMITTSAVEKNVAPIKVRFGRFEVDEAEARLLDDGEPVRLAPKPFAVLCALARTPHALLTKDALLDRVWGHQYVSDSVLKTTISDVRAVLGDDPRQPCYIETVSRRGYRFIGAVTAPVAPAPLPPPIDTPAVVASGAHGMIGRTRELERLRDAWRAARAGTRQVVWITGEAGVGKTTLIERFMHEVGDATCSHGHCVANVAGSEPGLPVLEALTSLCRRDPAIVELMRQVAPTWLSRLPWLCTPAEREALQREVGDAGHGGMLREMGELLDRCSAQQPLLLVSEDLQWADELTVQLIDYIARRRTGARLMWLASFRLTEVIAAEHPLATVRQELRLHGLGREILLDAFAPAEVAEYLAARLPASAGDRALAQAVYERTDGLPLFLADLVDQLVASIDEEPAAPMLQRLAAIPVPDSFAGIVERYLLELTPRQRSVLETASVCGRQFRLSTLADVLGGELSLLASACAELVRRQRWLREAPAAQAGASTDGAYVFRHGLHREVLYERIHRPARIELHRRLKASLDRDRPEPKPAASIIEIRGGASNSGRVERERRHALPMPA
jgi:DNA-binding winged helix-turn-helix (wHTH) protein